MKQIKIAVLMLAILFTCGLASNAQEKNTQEYKGRQLYGLNGPVKQYNCQSESKISNKKVNFTRDGLIKGRGYDYNATGYPTGCSFMYTFRGGLQGSSITFGWGEDGMLHDATYSNQFLDDKFNSSFELTYDEGMTFPSRVVVAVTQCGETQTTTYDYLDYKYDEYHNWTSRGVISKVVRDGKPIETKTYTEYCKYKYYK